MSNNHNGANDSDTSLVQFKTGTRLINSELPLNDPPALTLGDIYYALFRHKTKILLCSCAGVVMALIAYRLSPPTFQSEAKLFIRYVSDGKSLAPVVADGRSSSPTFGGMTAKSPDQRGETIMDSEIEIITSLDLARQVAKSIDPKLILATGSSTFPGSQPKSEVGSKVDRAAEIIRKILGMQAKKSDVGSDVDRAAEIIRKNLKVEIPSKSSVIRLVLSHTNPDIIQGALTELIEGYLKLHVETHRSVEIGDFLAQETTHFRSRLSQTEEELRNTRKNSGVISLEGSTKANAELIAAVRQQIFAAEAELVERSSFLQEEQKRTKARPAVPVPAGAQSIITRLSLFRKMEQELLTQFREEHSRVKDVRAQIADAEAAKRGLEEQYPNLVLSDSAVAAGQSAAPDTGMDIAAEVARVSALKLKITVLQSQLKELLAEAAVINQVEPTITDLRRKKDLEEANYHRFSASLEQARIDAELAKGQVSNIIRIQDPSPPTPNQTKTLKLSAILASGGIILGLSWAFLIEFYLDRSIRRWTDVERIARPPLFLSIPYFGKNGTRHLAGSRKALHSGEPRDKSNPAVRLRPFHEALRDQLIGYFEGKGLKHEPKLVGVTGIGANAGVSTIAAGLARSLSEIGEGNVLLVDMTIGQESARHFVRGEATCHLNQVLDTPAPALVAGNLYVASDNSRQDQLSDNLPQRFSKLAPKLRSSAFQYIIFDLPSISPISIASRVSPLMDFVVTVVQSEKTDQGVLERAMILLGQNSTPVGVVLNKTRTYVPTWLQQEFVGES